MVRLAGGDADRVCRVQAVAALPPLPPGVAVLLTNGK